jgi:hypothetical protein
VFALLIYLLLFVFPFISLKFEPPKVLFAEILIEILIVYVLMSGKFRLRKVALSLFVPVAVLFLLSLYHLLNNPSSANIFGNVFRLQGTILFWHLLVFALIVQNNYFRLKEKYVYITAFIAVCAGTLIFGNNSSGRLIGSLGEPNALGAVMVVLLPFVLLNVKPVWGKIAVVLAALMVVNYTQSRSALTGIGLELLFLMLLRSKLRFLPGFIICSILLVLSLVLPIFERSYYLKSGGTYFRFEDRAQIWEMAGKAGWQYPVFGTGIESVQGRINQISRRENAETQYQVIDSAHNIFLDYWIWGGGMALFALLTLIVIAVKNLVVKKPVLETTLFLGLLAVLLFNPTTVSVLAAFWFVLGRSFAKFDSE